MNPTSWKTTVAGVVPGVLTIAAAAWLGFSRQIEYAQMQTLVAAGLATLGVGNVLTGWLAKDAKPSV